jgi:hypothetical protein
MGVIRQVAEGRVELKTILAAMCLVACGTTAEAADRPTTDVAVSYTDIRAVDAGNDYPAGWLVSVGEHFTDLFGLAEEVGGSYKNTPVAGLPSLKTSTYNFMIGPRLSARFYSRSVVRPFVQLLVGIVQTENNYTTTTARDPALQPGFGIDVAASTHLAARVQGDFRIIEASGQVQEFRLAIGVVLRN